MLKPVIVMGREGLRVVVSVIRMVWCDIGYVRPAVQTLTITLPIHYCTLSTAYAVTIYNVIISNKS